MTPTEPQSTSTSGGLSPPAASIEKPETSNHLKLNHDPIEIPPTSIYTNEHPPSYLMRRPSTTISTQTNTVDESGFLGVKPEVEGPRLIVGDQPTVAEVGGKVLLGTGGPATGQFPKRNRAHEDQKGLINKT